MGVHNFGDYAKSPPKTTVDNGDGGGDDGDMEARVSALESTVNDIRERLAKMETRLDHTATKGDLSDLRADLHAAINAQTWKVIGSCAVLVAAVFGIAKYIH